MVPFEGVKGLVSFENCQFSFPFISLASWDTLKHTQKTTEQREWDIFSWYSGHRFFLFHNFWLGLMARGQYDVYSYKDCMLPGLCEQVRDRDTHREGERERESLCVVTVGRTRTLLMMFWWERFWNPSRGQHWALHEFCLLLSPPLFTTTPGPYIQKKKKDILSQPKSSLLNQQRPSVQS